MIRELICIRCPKGCHLKVDDKTLKVSGNGCINGEKYGISEVTNPVRTVTSTVKVIKGKLNVVPVKTDKPIPKGLMMKCMEEINKASIKAPVKIGDIVIENVLETGCNIIATRFISEK